MAALKMLILLAVVRNRYLQPLRGGELQDAIEGRQGRDRVGRQLTIQQKRVDALTQNAHG